MTSADRAARLAQHAQARHEHAMQRAQSALTAMAASTVTVSLLASRAGVSRSWIYTQPELLDQIEQLRQQAPRARPSSPAAGSHASIESMRRRLALAHQRIQQLRAENQQLRQSLACAHGQLRAATVHAATEPSDDRA